MAVRGQGHLKSVSIRAAADAHGGVYAGGGTADDSADGVVAALAERLAGRAAELACCGDVGAGAGVSDTSDSAVATKLAVTAETSGLGASLLWRGNVTADSLPVLLSDHALAARVEDWLARGQALADRIVSERRAAVDALTAALLRMETVSGADAETIIATALRGHAAPRQREDARKISR